MLGDLATQQAPSCQLRTSESPLPLACAPRPPRRFAAKPRRVVARREANCGTLW